MDVRQQITDKIVNLIETGGMERLKRWKRAAADSGMPINASTGKAYSGANVLVLWVAAMEAGYSVQKWLTYKQAAAMGGQVRKGEKSVICAYWSMVDKKAAKAANESDDDQKGQYLMCKPVWLFNVAQIDGLPAECYEGAAPSERFNHDPIEAAEKFIVASGATIRYGCAGAFYQPSGDFIGMPDRDRFYSAEAFYATMQHELTHWTGSQTRLNRQFGKRFGDEAYAFEELVAEFGAAFLAAHVGFIDATIEGHAHYLDSWVAMLKKDKQALFTAAKHASEAADYLLGYLSAEQREAA